MHIAHIAPLIEAVPPKLYGGTERVVHWLTEELVALGHDVTLFASGDSRTSGKLEAVWPRALRLDGAVRDPNALHMMMLERVRQQADEFDCLHFHLDYYPFSLFSRQAVPFVTTLHGRLDLPEHQPVFTTFPTVTRDFNFRIRSAGRSRRPGGCAPSTTVCRRTCSVRYRSSPSYLAFLGRIAPEKGIDRAIAIARHCGIPLKVAAKVDPMRPRLFRVERSSATASPANTVEYIGEISDEEKSEFFSGAMALLVPIDWPEPFGLVMIEAMACGTPVIAFNRGSVSEIIDEGVTGFIVEDENGAIGAVDRLPRLSRERIRHEFEAPVYRAADGGGLSRGLPSPDGRGEAPPQACG